MSTFEVGQKVKFVDAKHKTSYSNGDTGVVVRGTYEFCGDKFVEVKVDKTGDTHGVFVWRVVAVKPELVPALGDKVRYAGSYRDDWVVDGYHPEGTVVERRPDSLRVKWNGEKNNVTVSGYAYSWSEKAIKEDWEKIEEFAFVPKFKVGDWVKVVKNTSWGYVEGTVAKVKAVPTDKKGRYSLLNEDLGRWGMIHYESDLEASEEPKPKTKIEFKVGDKVEVTPKGGLGGYTDFNIYDVGTVAEVLQVDDSDTDMPYYIKTEGQSGTWSSASRVKAYVEPKKYKYAVGDTVEFVSNNGRGVYFEEGDKLTITEVGAEDYDYCARGNSGPRMRQYLDEDMVKPYKAHVLDGAEVGTIVSLTVSYTPDAILVKKGEDDWDMIWTSNDYHSNDGRTFNDKDAISHYDSFGGEVL